eukprot:superscaffoldBa00001593_g11231
MIDSINPSQQSMIIEKMSRWRVEHCFLQYLDPKVITRHSLAFVVSESPSYQARKEKCQLWDRVSLPLEVYEELLCLPHVYLEKVLLAPLLGESPGERDRRRCGEVEVERQMETARCSSSRLSEWGVNRQGQRLGKFLG